MTRSSYWYQDICSCDLDHLWNWPLSGAFVFHKHILFTFVLRRINMHLESNYCVITFLWCQFFIYTYQNQESQYNACIAMLVLPFSIEAFFFRNTGMWHDDFRTVNGGSEGRFFRRLWTNQLQDSGNKKYSERFQSFFIERSGRWSQGTLFIKSKNMYLH